MNPYWTNPPPDNDEFFHSEKVKGRFFVLVTAHVALWIASLAGVIVTYVYARRAPQIEAFTAGGEPAWGQPMPMGSAETQAKQEEFLILHLKEVFTHLLSRTEKGILPILQFYADLPVLQQVDHDFAFTTKKKGGWSQTFSIEEMENVIGDISSRRRIFRIKGNLSAHSLDGSSNTATYLLVAVDKRPGTRENPLGWVVSVVLSMDDKAYYGKERQVLLDEVTKATSKVPGPTPTGPNESLKNKPKNP